MAVERAVAPLPNVRRVARRCRVCSGQNLDLFLDLGMTPLANAFLATPLPKREPRYPLQVSFCYDCGHVQLVDSIPPGRLFSHYLYASSTSDTLRLHFAHLADDLIERQKPWQPGDLAIEIASNDGVLQGEFRRHGVRCIGVEPAKNLAEVARAAGHEVDNAFFNLRTARRLRKQYGAARVITGSNVLGHVDGLRDFVAGLFHLLADDGLVCMEVPHLLELLQGCEFDTIYHEHVSYMSLRVLRQLFAAQGLTLYDAISVPIHGGSIRVYARRASQEAPASGRLQSLLAEEEAARLAEPETYRDFALQVATVRKELLGLLRDLKGEGKRIAAYGAAAKGNTLLNYCGIGGSYLDYVVDKSPLKQGLFTPGMSLPVLPVEHLLAGRPDYLLILAWNFADEIMAQQAEYARLGGRFILPLPKPRIIEGSSGQERTA